MLCEALLALSLCSPVFIGPPAPLYPLGVEIRFRVTAYCVSRKHPEQCDHKYVKAWHGLTATGKKAQVGYCAADWDIIPPGSILYVPGYGRCQIEDRGSEVKGLHLDVFVVGPREAKAWGLKWLTVRLVRWGY